MKSSEHSYRTGGGIIESVVNVQGLSKTIIEGIEDSDDREGDEREALLRWS
jgi:hypothetical protein